MTTTDGPAPRVLMASIRDLNRGAAWCSNYEFEDVIRSVDNVDMLTLQPARWFETRQRLVRTLTWRRIHRSSSRLNPGVKPVRLGRDYDLFVFVCMNTWDLFYLNAIADWRTRCKTKVCFMVELWAGQAKGRQFEYLLGLAADFDHVVQSFSGSVAAVASATGRPSHHIPLASDVLRFTPFPQPPARVIDVLSIGRRAEPVHQVLRGIAAEQKVFYLHDTIPGSLVRPSDPAEHRDVLASMAKRSRCFITYPAKFGDEERQGQSEVGARYFEGAAAGAVLLGQAPTAAAFQSDFPGPEAVVEVRPDGSDVRSVLSDLLASPQRMEAMSRRNAVAALRRHDWAHRWQAVLDIAKLEPRPALHARLRRLDDLAAAADSEPAEAAAVAAHSTEGQRER